MGGQSSGAKANKGVAVSAYSEAWWLVYRERSHASNVLEQMPDSAYWRGQLDALKVVLRMIEKGPDTKTCMSESEYGELRNAQTQDALSEVQQDARGQEG